MTLEDLKSAIKSLTCPGTWSGHPRKGVQYEGKKNKCRRSRPTSTTTTHEQADFFSAEPHITRMPLQRSYWGCCGRPYVVQCHSCAPPQDHVCRHLTARTGKVSVLNERVHWLPSEPASRGSSIKPDLLSVWSLEMLSTPHNHNGVSQMGRIPPDGLIAAVDLQRKQPTLLTSCFSP